MTSSKMLWFLIIGIIAPKSCKASVLTEVGIADSMQQFNDNMYRILGQEESGNLIYSPYSIHVTMAMVLAGSPKDSQTYKQLASALGASDISPESFQIDNSLIRSFYKEVQRKNKNDKDDCQNQPVEDDYDYYDEEPCDGDPNLDIMTGYRIFAKKGLRIKDDYSLSLDTFFRAGNSIKIQINLNEYCDFLNLHNFLGVEEVDFGKGEDTARSINDFVNHSTNGLIKDIVTPSSFDSLTSLMLVNAIYFFGKWKMPFKKEETQPMEFQVEDGNVVKDIDGMNLEADFRQHKISTINGEIGVLEMPYKDEDFAMYLILPPEDSDIRDFNWTEINFKDLDSRMRSKLTKVQLPKFKIEYQRNLNELFQRLGANDAFSLQGKLSITR